MSSRTDTALVVFLALALVSPRLVAGQRPWQPSSGQAQMPMWPSAIPDPQPVDGPEESAFAVDSAGPDIHVTSQTPPTFLVQAEDDPVDPVENSLVYYAALRKAGVPAEIHVYAKGGHAFGLRRTESPITRWPELVEAWIGTITK